MNPNTSNGYEQPNMSLPEPLQGSGDSPLQSEQAGLATPEANPGQAIMAPPMPGPMLPLSPAPAPLPVPPATATATGTTPIPGMADDTDLIEKEWVVKAKAIVDRTREDPHEQTAEMSSFKADYLKKRYNKDIKVSEN